MRIPRGVILRKQYQMFDQNRHHPCGRGDFPQCAVRMSVALGRCDCDFNFSRWTHGGVHDRQGVCRDLPPHVTGSTELVRYLRDLGLPFQVHTKGRHGRAPTAQQIRQRVQGSMGIIYFRHCFDNGGRRGSHIDFWDGQNFMNQVLWVSAGGAQPASSDLFAEAEREIWFCPTP